MKHCLMAMLTGTALALTSCSTKTNTNAEAEEADDNGKVLVIYYSQTGTTQAVAEELQKELGADIAQIEAVITYPESYDETIERWKMERDSETLPAIKPINVNIADYSTIFLGFPIWGGTYALPVATFLHDYSLKGKKVVTFATFGSGGINEATENVKAAQPNADVVLGYGVRTARIGKAPAEIKRFLIEGGYIKGDIDPLPDYSKAEAVTDEEVAIFNKACDGYRFPLGTPITVGKRDGDNGTDYKFNVKGQMPDGSESESTIYVTVEKDGTTEFTLVDRSKK